MKETDKRKKKEKSQEKHVHAMVIFRENVLVSANFFFFPLSILYSDIVFM